MYDKLKLLIWLCKNYEVNTNFRRGEYYMHIYEEISNGEMEIVYCSINNSLIECIEESYKELKK